MSLFSRIQSVLIGFRHSQVSITIQLYYKTSLREGSWPREGSVLSLLVVRVGTWLFAAPCAHAFDVLGKDQRRDSCSFQVRDYDYFLIHASLCYSGLYLCTIYNETHRSLSLGPSQIA